LIKQAILSGLKNFYKQYHDKRMENAFLTIDHINEGFKILESISELRGKLEKTKDT